MPNGRPGDNPLTDILNYGHSEFDEPVDSIVKRIAEMNRSTKVMDEVEKILWKYSPISKGSRDGVEEAERLLLRVEQRIKHDGS